MTKSDSLLALTFFSTQLLQYSLGGSSSPPLQLDAAALSVIQSFDHDKAPASHWALVRSLNKHRSSWTAAVNKFSRMTVGQAKGLCGLMDAVPTSDAGDGYDDMLLLGAESFPKEFDARKSFPQCKGIIGLVRNQAQCGSCWAFAAVEAYNDNLCVATNGQKGQVPLSAQDTLQCAEQGMGCQGARSVAAGFDYFKKSGVVTGGLHGDYTTCKPYLWDGKSHGLIGQTEGQVCHVACDKESERNDYFQEKEEHHLKDYTYRGYASTADIKTALQQVGSVAAAMTVFSDFMSYENGVYQAKSSVVVGRHAVKILGWGYDNECACEYWTVANTWGSDWGEDGFFRIKIGQAHIGQQMAYANVV